MIKVATEDIGDGYNYKIDCNSDGTYEAEGVTGDYTCEYAISGTYRVSITGKFKPRLCLKFNHKANKIVFIQKTHK